jgi:hypothetical protein
MIRGGAAALSTGLDGLYALAQLVQVIGTFRA